MHFNPLANKFEKLTIFLFTDEEKHFIDYKFQEIIIH